MTEPRKAETGPPDLDLYALAQARVDQLFAALPRCKTCTGNCARPSRPVLGRNDWPTCPVAMISRPPWSDAMAYYRAAKISPLAGYPKTMAAWAFDAHIKTRDQVTIADNDRAREASRPGALPRYAGRRNIREEG